MTNQEKLQKILNSAGKSLKEKWKSYLEISAGENIPSIHQIVQIENLVANIPNDVKSVLVVGAGDGTEMELIGKTGRNVVGIQINPTQTTHCQEKGLDCRLMDMHELTFKENEFDLIFCKDTFKQAMSHIIVWNEFIRVARKYILISEPDERWAMRAHNYLLLTYDQFDTLAQKAGWRIETYWEIRLPYVTQRNYLFKVAVK